MTTPVTPRALPGIQITEAQFTDQLIDLARNLNWRSAHFRPAFTQRGWRTPVQGDGAGFPDLILVRGDRAAAAELKRPKTKTVRQAWASIDGWRDRIDAWVELGVDDRLFQPGQVDWLAAFDRAGFEVYLWTPDDDLDGIARTLR